MTQQITHEEFCILAALVYLGFKNLPSSEENITDTIIEFQFLVKSPDQIREFLRDQGISL